MLREKGHVLARNGRTAMIGLPRHLLGLDAAGVKGVKPEEFTRYGSARTLYNFNIDNADAY